VIKPQTSLNGFALASGCSGDGAKEEPSCFAKQLVRVDQANGARESNLGEERTSDELLLKCGIHSKFI